MARSRAWRRIEAADLQGFVATRLAKDNLRVGVAGDVTGRGAGRACWTSPSATCRRPARRSRYRRPGAARAAQTVCASDVPQSHVMFGEAGLARDDPDYYAAYVVNHILGGGGFTSR